MIRVKVKNRPNKVKITISKYTGCTSIRSISRYPGDIILGAEVEDTILHKAKYDARRDMIDLCCDTSRHVDPTRNPLKVRKIYILADVSIRIAKKVSLNAYDKY